MENNFCREKKNLQKNNVIKWLCLFCKKYLHKTNIYMKKIILQGKEKITKK